MNNEPIDADKALARRVNELLPAAEDLIDEMFGQKTELERRLSVRCADLDREIFALQGRIQQLEAFIRDDLQQDVPEDRA